MQSDTVQYTVQYAPFLLQVSGKKSRTFRYIYLARYPSKSFDVLIS